MMKAKKWIASALSLILLICLAACGSSPESGGSSAQPASQPAASASQASGETDGEPVTFLLFNNKYEFDTPLKEIAAAYKERFPNVTIEVETMTSDAYTTDLATRFAGGVEPDIFVCVGRSDIENWETHLEDLSDQPWIPDVMEAAKDPVSYNGAFYGMPLSMEAGGYMYNTRMFEEAGIEEIPSTPAEFEEAVNKLNAAGFMALTECYGAFYQPGNYMVAYGFAGQDDPMAFIEGLNAGTESIVGNAVFEEVVDYWMWESTLCTNPLGYSFAEQISMIANEELAITYGGNWSQLALDEIDPELPLSLMPIPIFDDPAANDYLLGTCMNYWVVNKNSPSKQAAKDFLNWLATDPEGQAMFTSGLKLIPGFNSFSASDEDVGSLGSVVSRYFQEGKVDDYYRGYFPSGATQAFGDNLGRAVAGEIDRDQFLQTMQDDWDRLK